MKNLKDKITVDVPLFIRLLEYAREDAKTDMDLHDVTENIIKLSEEGNTLSMKDYDKIVDTKKLKENFRMKQLAGILKEDVNKYHPSDIAKLKSMFPGVSDEELLNIITALQTDLKSKV